MSDDPVMRYIDVLKDQVAMLQRDKKMLAEAVQEANLVVAAYKKITNLDITVGNYDDDDNEPKYD
jgi:hypothetical protein